MQDLRLLQRVKQTIMSHGMLTPGDAVLSCVSGGPDSVALLHLLFAIAPELRLRLGVIHLNHGLRGAASDSDADFTRSIADNLHLPFFERKTDVSAFGKSRRLSLEEAARQMRYAYFTEIADAYRYDKIALGHHSDDNAELILMNLIRGSGPQGLAGIPPVREHRFIRPLIDTTRDQIKNFLDDNGIPYVIDASNQDFRHRRNRIRHQLIPLLQDLYNPDISGTLSRFAAIMRDENDWIDRLSASTFRECLLTEEDDRLIFSSTRLRRLERPLARRILRKGIFRLKGNLKRIRFSHIEAILDVIGEASDGPCAEKQLHLPDRIQIEKSADRLTIKRVDMPLRYGPHPGTNSIAFKHLVPRPGAATEIEIPEIGARMRFILLTETALPDDFSSPATACFDLDALVFPLAIRSPRPGDRFRPLGMKGSQKLKDFFINQKILRDERVRCPLLVSDGKILWIAGYRTSEFAKVSEASQKLLKVEFFLPNSP